MLDNLDKIKKTVSEANLDQYLDNPIDKYKYKNNPESNEIKLREKLLRRKTKRKVEMWSMSVNDVKMIDLTDLSAEIGRCFNKQKLESKTSLERI